MRRILIVDDEEDILFGLSRYLKRHGYEVITETSPKKALEVLSTEPADILITDIKMEELSGLDLIESAKRINKDIKVIVMTARGSEELERLATERGAMEYIEKPFDIDYLIQLLKKLEKGGFKGVVKELSITDMLNILHMERSDALIRISSTAGTGRIYIEGGEIVHAVFGEKEGMEALKALFSLEGGTFSVDKGVKPPKKTIDMPFNSLMLEIFAQIDEESAGILKEEGENEEEFQITGSIFSGIIEEEEEQKEVRSIPEEVIVVLEDILSKDSKISSIEIYESSGHLLFGNGYYESLVRGLIDVGRVVSGFIEKDSGTLIYVVSEDDYFVLLTLENVSISLARVEYSRVIKRIIELLHKEVK